MTVSTMRQGFTPYARGERAPGRSVPGGATLDALAVRRCGRTVLAAVAAESTLHRLRNRPSDLTGYAVVALGNAGREARYLARFDTLARAVEYLEAYSPKLGLIGKG